MNNDNDNILNAYKSIYLIKEEDETLSSSSDVENTSDVDDFENETAEDFENSEEEGSAEEASESTSEDM
jgi:hypothetical protein